MMADIIMTVSLHTTGDPGGPLDSERIWGIEAFASDVVPQYMDTQFKEHFRMYHSTFEVTP